MREICVVAIPALKRLTPGGKYICITENLPAERVFRSPDGRGTGSTFHTISAKTTRRQVKVLISERFVTFQEATVWAWRRRPQRLVRCTFSTTRVAAPLKFNYYAWVTKYKNYTIRLTI